jgi:hypothetical protein
MQHIKELGITVEQNFSGFKEHEFLKHCIYSGKISLPNYPPLLSELKYLILQKEKITTSGNHSKDCADATANATFALQQSQIRVPKIISVEPERIYPLSYL